MPEPNKEEEAIPVTAEQLRALQKQGFPQGLARQVCTCKGTFPLRFWIVDNSGSMLTSDGHELRGSRKTGYMVVPCTRWAELKSTVSYHMELAALLQSTTTFRFLNDPGARAGPQELGIAQLNDGAEVVDELTVAQRVVQQVVPKGATPLTYHLQEIRLRVEAMEEALKECGQSVAIILATDGLPTNTYGDATEQVQLEFIDNLKALQALPVWIVVRLCTDDEAVVEFYNELDASLELPLEVIDDHLGEAREIQKHNAWLNYATPLHRCREMGYHHRIFDLLDERLLNADELREFLQLLFGHSAIEEFPDLYLDWKGFVSNLQALVARQDNHYNPLAAKPTPWIDMKQLEKSFGHLGKKGGGIFRRARRK